MEVEFEDGRRKVMAGVILSQLITKFVIIPLLHTCYNHST